MPGSNQPERKPGLLWPLVIGSAVVLLVVLGVVAGLRDPDEGETADDSEASAGTSEEMRELGESLARRDADDSMAMGDADAPVVLIAYSDYQCPFCASWARETQPELVARYVEDGSLRIEWREFPYLGEASKTLAVGARAAAEQQAFWEYHEAVYDIQDELKSAGPELEERMVDTAAGVGLDTDRFTEDLEREDLASKVEEDFAEGQEIGVSGTPAFLVNGDPIIGAQPLPEFTSSIDAALAEAGG